MLNPLPPAGAVGSYKHHDIGEEVEWRPPLLYANPLGHCVPATLKICQKCAKREPKTGAWCNARCAQCVCFSHGHFAVCYQALFQLFFMYAKMIFV